MTFMEYVRRSQSLRSDTAGSRPALFYLKEVVRYAAVMALVLVVADATPLAFQSETPLGRIWFIGCWSVIMAGWSLWRTRVAKGDARGGTPFRPEGKQSES